MEVSDGRRPSGAELLHDVGPAKLPSGQECPSKAEAPHYFGWFRRADEGHMTAAALLHGYGCDGLLALASLISYSLSNRLNMTVESSLSCGAELPSKDVSSICESVQICPLCANHWQLLVEQFLREGDGP